MNKCLAEKIIAFQKQKNIDNVCGFAKFIKNKRKCSGTSGASCLIIFDISLELDWSQLI